MMSRTENLGEISDRDSRFTGQIWNRRWCQNEKVRTIRTFPLSVQSVKSLKIDLESKASRKQESPDIESRTEILVRDSILTGHCSLCVGHSGPWSPWPVARKSIWGHCGPRTVHGLSADYPWTVHRLIHGQSAYSIFLGLRHA